MKIAVVGCGAVGSFYGAKLACAGHEVHFLLRSDYEVVRRQGVYVRSFQGDFRAHPLCARLPSEIGFSDLVLIGLKTTANDQLPRLLPSLVAPGTAVLTLQNGLGNEGQIARLFPVDQILGGLCFVCLNRLEPGLIHHTDYGLVIVGEFQRRPTARTGQIAAQFRQAGVPCSVTDDLARAHWEKLTWNIPFNGLGVAGVAGVEAVVNGQLPRQQIPEMGQRPSASERGGRWPRCLATDKLLGDPRWLQLLRELISEVITAARGVGFDLPESLVEKQIERTRTMGAYKASTLIDFERGQPLELESLFLEPLRQAQEAGVPVPRLEALCRLLQQLDRMRPAMSGPAHRFEPAKGSSPKRSE
jgi:2-dehydropantoate 2-reductase